MAPSLMLTILFSAVLCLQLGSSFGFQSIAPSRSLACSNRMDTMRAVINEENDFPPEEDSSYESSVDWDSEWKKVVQSEGKMSSGDARPGQDFYKSEAEIAAIKAANKAAAKASEVTSSVTDNLPQLSSFTGDWKFWIAILAIVSIGLSVLTAPPQTGSYYI